MEEVKTERKRCPHCHKIVYVSIGFIGDGNAPDEMNTYITRMMKEFTPIGSELKFMRMQTYLETLKNKTKIPDGIDEYGKVPYICENCKQEEATNFSTYGNFCEKCDRKIGFGSHIKNP
jgi:ribosomal protein L37AE/L43A